MSWMLYAAVAPGRLAAADVFVKMAAGKVANSLGMLIYGAAAFGIGLSWFVVDRAGSGGERSRRPVSFTPWALVLRSGVVAVALYGAFRAGAPLSIISPLVRLSGLIVASHTANCQQRRADCASVLSSHAY